MSHAIIQTSARTRRRQRRMSCYTTFQGVTQNFSKTTKITEQCRVTRHFNQRSTLHGFLQTEMGRTRTMSCWTTFSAEEFPATRVWSHESINIRLRSGFFGGSRRRMQMHGDAVEAKDFEFFFSSIFITFNYEFY